MSLKKRLLRLFFLGFLFLTASPARSQETLHLYTAAHNYVPAELIHRFEQETGIQVSVDIFDNDDVLEAKLLAGAGGYDLVFPTAFPYGMRQIAAGFYQEIDWKKIPNVKKIKPFFTKNLEGQLKASQYFVPFLWGIVGFAYNVEYIEKNFPEAPVDSWAMFFDPTVIQKMSPCGVTMLEDSTDVILPAKLYLGLDPSSESKKDLEKVVRLLQKVRPFINRFDLFRSSDEIARGEMCLVHHWLGAIALSSAHLTSSETRANIKLVIPKEGTVMWMDVMAIPKSVPPERLGKIYQFIDFILRPENIALVTNETYFANSIEESLPFVQKEIRENEAIFPPEKVLNRVLLHKSFSPKYQKMLTRALIKIRSGLK